MERPLVGRSILVVEDEPLVALDVAHGLESAGARVLMARTLADALNKADDPALSAAVLDHGLSDGDTSEVCERLKKRNIPFVLYSGYSKIEGACSEGELVHKPAHPQVLVVTVTGMLRGRPISN
jgi:DNA-binding response OmpR family regulator